MKRVKVPGMKIWTWGTADDGAIWTEPTTDSGIPAGEVQAGTFETQSEYGMLEPHRVITRKEYWWAPKNIGGVIYANKDIALNLRLLPDKTKKKPILKIALDSSSKFPGAKLLLKAKGERVYQCKIDITPGDPFSKKIPVSIEDMNSEITIQLFSFSGEKVLVAKDRFYLCEGARLTRAIYLLAHLGKGRELYKSGSYLEAIEHFKASMEYPLNLAVGKPTKREEAEAYFWIGLCYEALGKKQDAEKAWKNAIKEQYDLDFDWVPYQTIKWEHTTLNWHYEEWTNLYYQGLSFQKLRREKESFLLFDKIYDFAKARIEKKEGEMAMNHCLSGLIYKGKGGIKRAKEEFEKALDFNPNHRRAKWELKELERETL